MRQRKWSYNIIIRYALFQIPGLLVLTLTMFIIMQWLNIPRWFFWVITLLWIIKDAAMYPFVWRAYDTSIPGGAESMTGMQGTARERMDPSGYILVGGELWHAELPEGSPPVEKGEKVQIQGHRGHTLLVAPERDSGRQP